MSVSILIPCYKRKEFSKLISYNINIQTYKNIKEIIVIDEDGSDGLDLNINKNHIKILFLKCDERLTIGEKRNRLIKASSSKYSIFFDTDDFYFENYISSSIQHLETNKNKKIVGSADMLFYYKNDNSTSKMSCIKLSLIHEATLCCETKWFKKNIKFLNKSNGEGDVFKSHIDKIIENDINNIMVCFCHENNTIDKNRWKNKNLKLNLDLNNYVSLI